MSNPKYLKGRLKKRPVIFTTDNKEQEKADIENTKKEYAEWLKNPSNSPTIVKEVQGTIKQGSSFEVKHNQRLRNITNE
jgi:deoxyadenosine/deoxycytidine kinase